MLPGLHKHLAPLDLGPLHAPQEAAHIVARFPVVQRLLEHLHPGHDHLAALAQAHDLDLVPGLDPAPLDPPGHHRAPPLDPEDIFDRHQEGLIDRPLRRRHVIINRLHQLQNGRVLRGAGILAGTLQGRQAPSPG